MFYVSQLRRYVKDDSHIVDHTELELRPDLSYSEKPVAVIGQSLKKLNDREIPLVLVSWNGHSPGDRWAVRENHSDTRRYAPSVHVGL